MDSKFIRILAVAFFAVQTSASAQNQILMSFDEAITMAYTNNHGLKQADAAVQEKERLEAARKGLYFPTIGLSASVARMPEDLHLDLNPVKNTITPLYQTLGAYGQFSGAPTGNPAMQAIVDAKTTEAVRAQLNGGLAQIEATDWNTLLQKKQFGMVDVTASWVLYAGGKVRAANKIAQLQTEESRTEMNKKKAELFAGIVQQYYGLALARHATELRLQADDAMKRNLEDATKMEAQGMLAQAELLRIRMGQAETQRELMKARRTEILLSTALQNAMAYDSIGTIIPVSPLFVPADVESADHFITIALQKNISLQQLSCKYSQTQQNIKVERADMLPSVAMMGMYDIYNKDLSPMAPDWVIGAGLKWTIFEGNARNNKLKAAKLKSLQVEEFTADAELNIRTAITKLHNDIGTGIEQIEQLEIAQQFADEYVRAREKAFAQEMSNAAELADARLALAKVSVERYQAMYQVDLALAQILYLCGDTDKFAAYQAQN